MSEYDDDYDEHIIDDTDGHDSDDDASDVDDDTLPALPAPTETSRLIGRTWFDEYFTLNHRAPKTSSTVFSHQHAPLSPQAYAAALASSAAPALPAPAWLAPAARAHLFPRLRAQLDAGFSVLAYGAGSKRALLNAFAAHLHARRRPVFVANAYAPAFALKDLLTSVENLPALLAAGGGGGGVEAQARRIHRFFSAPVAEEDGEEAGPREIYVVVHNIDAPALRAPRAQACLALLAAAPRIHVLASADTVAFPAMWSFSEAHARASSFSPSPSSSSTSYTGGADTHGGFAWLFHDLTTLAPYAAELSHADRASLRGAVPRTRRDAAPGTAVGGAAALLSEAAARHVLASVTKKAKRLFVLLGTKQLELVASLSSSTDTSSSANANEKEGGNTNVIADPTQIATPYAALFHLARDDFVATSDTALRALMGEFRDHGLMVGVGGGGGTDAVWIPLRREVLVKLVAELRQEG